MVPPEWTRLTQFVGLFIGTGYVAGEHAQSLLLIGEPGVGKSVMIRRFAKLPTTRLVMDLTSDGLRHKILKDAASKGHRHILFPEFIKLFQRRDSTVENTVGLLSLAMSGELHDQFIGNFDAIKYEDGLQVGVIAGMPTRVFSDWQAQLSNLGVMSRMAMVEVSFSKQTRTAIEVAIAMGDTSMTEPVHWNLPDGPREVKWNGTRHGSKVLALAAQVMPKGDRNRLIATLVSLLKSAAVLNGKKEVTDKEFEQMQYFLPLLRNIKG